MIDCKACAFHVSELMKHALISNKCPSCGAGLFSDQDSYVLDKIQSKISLERFASRLTSDLIYDISLFFFKEVKAGTFKELQLIEPEEETNIVYSEGDDIRKEVEAEFIEDLKELDGVEKPYLLDDEDIDAKALRLRKMNQQRVKENPAFGQPRTFKRTRVNRTN